MNIVQKHLLGLLVEIDEICKANNLRYYLAGGSLVGAIRHKGFLPWDDDADIHMPREDAFKLLELSHNNKLPENRIVASYHDFDEMPLLHWRYQDTSTSVLLRSTYTTHTPQGQFIDIFVLNPSPSEDSDRERFDEDYQLYWDLFCNHVIDSRRSDVILKRYETWSKLRKHGFEGFMHRHFRKKLFEIPEDKSDEYTILSPAVSRRFIKRDIFGTPRRVPFEDTTLCVAEQAEEMICYVYGPDWINVPRLQERESHVLLVDFDFPYEYPLHDIEAMTDRFHDGVLSWEWKNEWMSCMADRNYVNPRTREMGLILRAMEYEASRAEVQFDIRACIKNRDYGPVRSFYRSYNEQQFGELASYWNLFMPINDAMIWEAMYPEYMCGDFSRPLKVLGKRVAFCDEALSPELQDLREKCEDARELTVLLWTKNDLPAACEIANRHLAEDEDPSVIYFNCKLMHDIRLYDNVKCFESCMELVNTASDRFPDNCELDFWKGELLRNNGEVDESLDYYRKAARYCINGLIQTRAKEILAELEDQGLGVLRHA